MRRDYTLFIKDVITQMEDVESFVKDMSFEEFVADKKTVNAVIRSIEVMGEATRNIPKFIREKYPEIPWRDMAKMRNRLIHVYFGIDLDAVWKTVKVRIPAIKPLIWKVLKEVKNEERKT